MDFGPLYKWNRSKQPLLTTEVRTVHLKSNPFNNKNLKHLIDPKKPEKEKII